MDPFIVTNLEDTEEFNENPSFGHLLIQSLSNAGDKVVLTSGITSEEISRKELLERSIAVSKSLIAAGIRPGDVISIVSENRFEFTYVLFGSLLLNCTFAPINLTYSEREMAHAFNLSKPKVIFMSPFASEKVVRVANSLNFLQALVLIDEENSFGSDVTLFNDFVYSPAARSFVFNPKAVKKTETVSVVLCSSGTTGLAKGVQLSQDNLFVVTR
jgi:long-subunit acyl-CoA synthetase (AMP-forming)